MPHLGAPRNTYGHLTNAQILRKVYRNYLWDNRDTIIIIGFAISICLQALISFVPGVRRKKAFIESSFKSIMPLFSDDKEKTRMTLYVPRFGVLYFIQYLHRCFMNIEAIRAHIKKRIFWYHFRRIPLPWRKYLIPYKRYGIPCENPPSSTYFDITRDYHHAEGIIPHVWSTGKNYCSDALPHSTPSLSLEDIIAYRSIDEIRRADSELEEKVKIYMKIGKIMKYETLISFHKLFSSIWSSKIQYGTINIGVLVIDSNLPGKPFLNDKLQQSLLIYSQSLGMSLGTFSN